MAKTIEEGTLPIEKQPGVKVVQTNCFECHSKCGVLAYVKDGRLIKVKGSPNDPRSQGVMCTKGQAATQILYSPDRLNHCLRRTRPKGDPDPGWEKISHAEAMDIISERARGHSQGASTTRSCHIQSRAMESGGPPPVIRSARKRKRRGLTQNVL